MTSYTLPAFWNVANQFTGRFDWSELIHNRDWISNPERIPNLSPSMRTAFKTMTPRQIEVPYCTMLDPVYPSKLRTVPFAPPILLFLGNVQLLESASISILGSRQCTQQGIVHSRALSRYFMPTHSLIGGLTQGIEYHAQCGILDTEQENCPIINITTRGITETNGWASRHLQRTLQYGGLVLSEHIKPTPYRRWQYAQRNRLISALSDTVIVVEARMRSGVLNTATMAAEYGANVYAFRHSDNQAYGHGCNFLIEQGAHTLDADAMWLKETQSVFWQCLSSPKTVSDIATILQQPEDVVLQGLLFWNSKGQVRQRGNLWERY